MRNRRPGRRRASLTTRILAVNSIALGLLGASLFYLDSYRKQLIAERSASAQRETEIIAEALRHTALHGENAPATRVMLAGIGTQEHLRLRLFDAGGKLLTDSFTLAPPSFTLADPRSDPPLVKAARWLDEGMDILLGARALPDYHESLHDDQAAHWPEIAQACRLHRTIVMVRYAPDRTHFITAATPVEPQKAMRQGAGGTGCLMLLAARNDPDVTQNVRDARQTLALVVAAALSISMALSFFLARTIVEPLRKLVRAAVRVRLGRDRAVVVPRLPDRRDEIGLLARAISDMTAALRQRIDAMEAFAADVAHEIKNPLASLRSALESLDKVEDADLRRQLATIAAHDVQRIDRLITEIADASRIDAELSRTTFVPVDLLALTETLIGARERRGAHGGCKVDIVRQGERHEGGDGANHDADGDRPVVAGDPARLARVFENLLDNAVSFSPPGGTIAIGLSKADGVVSVNITDEGPGITQESRERVFERFHSLRPPDEAFGSHSGLGLAIARTIVEAHDGTLTAREPHQSPRGQAGKGARLVIELPAWHDPLHEHE